MQRDIDLGTAQVMLAVLVVTVAVRAQTTKPECA
eukprot:COSAG01_NODE_30143_length_621_cov_14.440613_1_plen_33_part_10